MSVSFLRATWVRIAWERVVSAKAPLIGNVALQSHIACCEQLLLAARAAKSKPVFASQSTSRLVISPLYSWAYRTTHSEANLIFWPNHRRPTAPQQWSRARAETLRLTHLQNAAPRAQPRRHRPAARHSCSSFLRAGLSSERFIYRRK
jgi:hypothetical protein